MATIDPVLRNGGKSSAEAYYSPMLSLPMPSGTARSVPKTYRNRRMDYCFRKCRAGVL
jgi:hypothetical protein